MTKRIVRDRLFVRQRYVDTAAGAQLTAQNSARRIRSAQIRINDRPSNPLAPFGGFRMSGHGRAYGKFGLTEFLSPKSVQL